MYVQNFVCTELFTLELYMYSEPYMCKTLYIYRTLHVQNFVSTELCVY